LWLPRIVMVPAPACITLRPLPTVPASCFATPHPGLSVVALVLFVLFASLVAPALFPVQLLDPTWQLRLAGSLINSAPFPLLGLALLQIAAELGPHDPLLKNRARLCAQLAVAAALRFLLLLPLQTVAGLQQGRSLNQAQAARLQGAEAKLKVLRLAVASATSNADLNQQLQKLSGPVLCPADIAQPLPLLKAQVAAALDQAALQITREREASQPRTPLLLLSKLAERMAAVPVRRLWPAHQYCRCRLPPPARPQGSRFLRRLRPHLQKHRLWVEGLRQQGVRISSCPQASPTSASTAATSPSLR